MRRSNKKGFTIVELVIVIAVIAILAAVMIPTFTSLTNDAKDSARDQDAKNAFTNYLIHNDGVATDITAIILEEDGKVYEYPVVAGNIDLDAASTKAEKKDEYKKCVAEVKESDAQNAAVICKVIYADATKNPHTYGDNVDCTATDGIKCTKCNTVVYAKADAHKFDETTGVCKNPECDQTKPAED